MSDPNTLGRLVRRRRLESGYSLGQLASKVGKTASEVRAWERDDEFPEHGILERLAETLELDLAEIRARLDAEAGDAAQVEDEVEAAAPVAETREQAEAEEAEDVVEAEDPVDSAGDAADDLDDEPGFAVTDPFTPPGGPDDGDGRGGAKPEFDLLDAPTEPVPVPVITDTAAAARAERAVAVLEGPTPLPSVESAPDSDPGLLRYLEPIRILFDPHNRYLYWVRAGLTVIVMLIFAVILLDQFGNLLDAIGELLDTIEPSATTPDELDAAGLISG